VPLQGVTCYCTITVIIIKQISLTFSNYIKYWKTQLKLYSFNLQCNIQYYILCILWQPWTHTYTTFHINCHIFIYFYGSRKIKLCIVTLFIKHNTITFAYFNLQISNMAYQNPWWKAICTSLRSEQEKRQYRQIMHSDMHTKTCAFFACFTT